MLTHALHAASQAAEFTRARYDSGTVGYLEFLDAERTRLQTERQANQVTAQRFIATVRLVKAMGGGWSAPIVKRTSKFAIQWSCDDCL